jgi:hypothetical protein
VGHDHDTDTPPSRHPHLELVREAAAEQLAWASELCADAQSLTERVRASLEQRRAERPALTGVGAELLQLVGRGSGEAARS